MLSDKVKQKARYGILERLKQKGMPGLDMSPVSSPMASEEMGTESPEETLNDMGIEPTSPLKKRLARKPARPAGA